MYGERVRKTRRVWWVPLAACAALVGLGTFAVVVGVTGAPPPGGVSIQGETSLVRFQGSGDHDGRGDGTMPFTISGDATRVLSPGSSSAIDLSFTNRSEKAIRLPSRAIAISIRAPSTCPASPNFTVVRTLLSAITIPRRASDISLADLGVVRASWPVIEMVTTGASQDACEGATLVLRYTARVDHDDD